MTNKPINFTKSVLENLSPMKGKNRQSFRDAQVKGLVIDVRLSGSKSFYVHKKIKGRSEKILLGSYPDLSIENARKLALVKLGEIALGKNPQEELRKVKTESTFEQLFQDYMNRYSKKQKKSWRYDEREVNKFLSHWFKRKISDITRTDVQKLIEKVHDENGLYQSNRLLERIRAIYNKAIEWGWEGTNPSVGIKKYREKQRDRFVMPAEMPCLLKSIEEEPNRIAKDYFWMLLLTGARRTNTIMMRWDQISWDLCLWRIPDTKNGEPVTIPLVERAIEILKNRKIQNESEWVFPNNEDKTKHLVNFKRAWKRTLQKATIYFWNINTIHREFIFEEDLLASGYSDVDFSFASILKRAKSSKCNLPTALMDLHIHDIRRTFGSYQAISGASLQIIGKSLGHKSSQSTQIYARLNLDPVRHSIEKATSVMLGY